MDEEQPRERADTISRLFALITMKLEDAARIAAECQARRPEDQLLDAAEKLSALISEAATDLTGTADLLQGDQ